MARVAVMLPRVRSGDRGASATEYAAVVLLIGAVVTVVLSVGVPERVASLYDTAFCAVDAGEDCATHTTESAANPDESSTPHQRQPTIPEDGSQCLPLCEPIPGEVNLADHPDPPPHPEAELARESRAEYDTLDVDAISGRDWRRLWLQHELEAKHHDARMWARMSNLRDGFDDARAALHHFLDNSGEPFDIDVDRLIEDVPEFQDEVDQARASIGQRAIQEAKERQSDSGTLEPMTFPVSTEWNAFGYNAEGTAYIYDDANWINALGSWNYNITGEVTVSPPESPGAEWTYDLKATTNVQKYYDWDEDATDPAVGAGPFVSTFSEQDLWNMHRTGLAQEFWMRGSSELRTGS